MHNVLNNINDACSSFFFLNFPCHLHILPCSWKYCLCRMTYILFSLTTGSVVFPHITIKSLIMLSYHTCPFLARVCVCVLRIHFYICSSDHHTVWGGSISFYDVTCSVGSSCAQWILKQNPRVQLNELYLNKLSF